MEQKSIFDYALGKVFEVFVREPLLIHFVKEISRKINLAHTSVKKHLDKMLQLNLISREKGERFFGYKANRDSDEFIFCKKIFNLINLKKSGIIEKIKDVNYPRAIVLYGSYLRGEDIEKSDVDVFLLSNSRKLPCLEDYEEKIGRDLHIIIEKDLNQLPDELRSEILNGFVLDGYLKWTRFSK